ncbi:MAG TPA: helix-turn-helix domain-containing protein, partial [Solirubrobacterales bacterium]|nr:helix-turn-helix domain-containing protein [Solirubrobacterales bacterium]
MAAEVDAVFAALADPTRRRVIETLAAGSTVTASGLAAQLPITRQAVSKHLGALSRATWFARRGSVATPSTGSRRGRSRTRRAGSSGWAR